MSKARRKRENQLWYQYYLLMSVFRRSVYCWSTTTWQSTYILSSGESLYRGWDALQSLAKKIPSLEKPELITPTRTRKYVAMLMQLLDMTDVELSWLTNHMGHTKDIHFVWYRKEDSHVELTKVVKALTAVDSGENIQNKKIDYLSHAGSEIYQSSDHEENDIGDDKNEENNVVLKGQSCAYAPKEIQCNADLIKFLMTSINN